MAAGEKERLHQEGYLYRAAHSGKVRLVFDSQNQEHGAGYACKLENRSRRIGRFGEQKKQSRAMEFRFSWFPALKGSGRDAWDGSMGASGLAHGVPMSRPWAGEGTRGQGSERGCTVGSSSTLVCAL